MRERAVCSTGFDRFCTHCHNGSSPAAQRADGEAAAAGGHVELDIGELGAKQGAANWPATWKAIQAGVRAIEQAGGGTLRIPAGSWTTAPFNMTSDMTLLLERGAVLLGTTVFSAHPIVPPLPSCESPMAIGSGSFALL